MFRVFHPALGQVSGGRAMLLACVVVVGLAPAGRWLHPTRAACRAARPALLSAQPPAGSARRAPPAGATDARRSRFRREGGPPIVCAPSLAAYQAALREHVLPGDTVVEVGCQLGGTTALLAERAGRVFGVDMARDLASSAVRKSNAAYRQHATPADAGLPEHVSLALLDPWDGAAMGALTDGLEVDVLLRLGLGFGLGLGLGLGALVHEADEAAALCAGGCNPR